MNYIINAQKETSFGSVTKEISRKFKTLAEAKAKLESLAKVFETEIKVDPIGEKFDCIWKDYVEDENGEKYFICEVC